MGCWACFSGEAYLGLRRTEVCTARVDSDAFVVRVSAWLWS